MGVRRPLTWVACVVALGLAGEGALAEAAEGEHGSGAAKAEPVFAPEDSGLPASAPERAVRAALERGDRDEARRTALAALGRTRNEARGRLRWLIAKASDDDATAVRQLEVLWQSRNPLRRWAGLELARRLRASEPKKAAVILAELGEGWVGAERARALEAKLSAPHEAPAAAASTIAPAAAPAPETPLAPADELARGERLLAARRYEQAEVMLAALLARADVEPALRCEARLAHGRSLAYRKERTDAAEIFTKVASECDEPEVKTWARFHAGRALLRAGAPSGAIAHYEALRRDAPEHSLADDALYAEAIAREDAGDETGARVALTSLLERYPTGDMRGEARAKLAFAARARGDHADALAHFEALAGEEGDDVLEGGEGRARYWQARSLEALDRTAEAAQAYEEVARHWPLGFHARQALARLAKLRPVRAKALEHELSAGPLPRPLRIHGNAALSSPEMQTAIELLRVGETDLALEELGALGLTGADAGVEDLWVVAALLHHAGEYPEALRFVRRRLDVFRTEVPHGDAHARWRIGYPRAFSPLVERAARESKVPAAFLRAVAREESSFVPHAVSTARAYGLVQLLEGTAKRHATALRLPGDAEALKRPDVNLRVGARFIHELWRRYGDNPALIPAAYNAGGAAVDRWLAERPGMDVDEWIENIPYAETRRYTRRVLQSYVAYGWLDGGTLVEWSMKLPRAP